MKYFFALFFIATSFKVGAQNYPVVLIPDSLKINAHSVKRMELLHVNIKALNKVIVKHKWAITILDEQGDEESDYSNSYSSMEDLSHIDGYLYDASGKKIQSVKRKDIADKPMADGFSLMRDDRIKSHNFYHRVYPYTVEYEDEKELNSTYHLPFWMPVESEKYAVQQSRFIVETSPEYNLRIKQLNFLPPPAISKSKTTQYVWETTNRKALVEEPFQPPFKELIPIVYIGPSDFLLGNYSGNMSSWQNLGKLNLALNQGRDELPPAIKEKVHQLVDKVSDLEEKVKILYQFMQSGTRYISVQLGIGGWQPFDAKYVADNKYGDCKALSNYMISLLKEAGIKANYVLVTAGENQKGLSEDFPSPYFNHIISCVPNGKDTIWLESTDQTKSAGYMGSFTGDRKVLLIDSDGGHVVSTPKYSAADNIQMRNSKAVLDKEGNLVVDVNTHSTGLQQELQHALMHDATSEQRTKYLNKALSLGTYEVDKSDYREQKGKIPVMEEYLHVKVPSYATLSGKRIFILPNLFNRSRTKLSDDPDRKYPICFDEAFKDVDTVTIQIPEGYNLEAMPKSVSIHNEFGDYDISYKVNGTLVEMIRTNMRGRKELPAADYPLLVKYFDTIYKADHSRIVFVKKEG